MLTRAEKPPTLAEFLSERRAAPASMLDMKLRGAARGIRAITMREYLAQRRK